MLTQLGFTLGCPRWFDIYIYIYILCICLPDPGGKELNVLCMFLRLWFKLHVFQLPGAIWVAGAVERGLRDLHYPAKVEPRGAHASSGRRVGYLTEAPPPHHFQG